MPKIMGSIGSGLKYFFLELIDASSTRVQLVWLTFFAWMVAIGWAIAVLPIVREVSAIFYRQNCISASPIDLNSSYTGTALTMTGSAFVLVVGGYITSKWSDYQNSGPVSGEK